MRRDAVFLLKRPCRHGIWRLMQEDETSILSGLDQNRRLAPPACPSRPEAAQADKTQVAVSHGMMFLRKLIATASRESINRQQPAGDVLCFVGKQLLATRPWLVLSAMRINL